MTPQSIDNRTHADKAMAARAAVAQRLQMLAAALLNNHNPSVAPSLKDYTLAVLDRCKIIAEGL